MDVLTAVKVKYVKPGTPLPQPQYAGYQLVQIGTGKNAHQVVLPIHHRQGTDVFRLGQSYRVLNGSVRINGNNFGYHHIPHLHLGKLIVQTPHAQRSSR